MEQNENTNLTTSFNNEESLKTNEKICIFIFHDSFSSPEDNWYQPLKKELSAMNNVECILPKFPTPLGQSLESWNIVFAPFRLKITSDSIFISHGTSSLFVFQLLQTLSFSIKALILVAPSYKAVESPVINDLNASFLQVPQDWKKISSCSRTSYLYCSTNDELVQREQSEFIKEKLQGTLLEIQHAGHFSKKDNYENFPELAELIKKIISTPEVTTEEKMRQEILRAGYHVSDNSKNHPAGISTFYDDISKEVTGEEAKALTTLLSGQKEFSEKNKELDRKHFNNLLRGIFAIVFVILSITLYYLYNSSKETNLKLTTLNNLGQSSNSNGTIQDVVLIDTTSKDLLLDKIKMQFSKNNSSPQFAEALLSRINKKKAEKVNLLSLAKYFESNFEPSLFENINDYHYLIYKGNYNDPILLLDSKNSVATLASLYTWGNNLPADLSLILNLEYTPTPNQEINIHSNEKNSLRYFEVIVSTSTEQGVGSSENQVINTSLPQNPVPISQNNSLTPTSVLLYFAPLNEHYFIMTKNLTNLIEILQNSEIVSSF